jgi:thiol-disulfide isomerase/thioredoxin
MGSAKSGSTRKAEQMLALARARRRRAYGWGAVGVVLVAVVALVVVATSSKGSTGSTKGAVGVSVGDIAPNGAYTTTSGQVQSIAGLRGQPALVWFVTTWCSSCQAGTQAMASAIDSFDSDHVKVVEVENWNDLGQAGPPISAFGQQLAGSSYSNPDWIFGMASRSLTTTYNPAGYLDIYYLLDSSGKVVYINSSPGSTMNELLAKAAALKGEASSKAAAASSSSETPAPAAVVNALASIPASVADAVGLPSSLYPPTLLAKQPPLVENGKPAVIYVGAEYCPYCAAERWAAVVALSRFGTFSHLGMTHSSDSDVYPHTVTFSYYGSTYTSPYITFDPTETNTNQPSPQGGYVPLQPLVGLAKKTFNTYDFPPYVSSSSAGAIPFYDIGNRVLVSGASYSPQILQGLSASKIAADLSNPSSPVAQAVVGAASFITAGICSITDGQPGNVCQQPYVLRAANVLKLPLP